MKLANTEFLRKDLIFPAWETLLDVERKLLKKYSRREEEDMTALIRSIPEIYHLLNGEFKGKRVLDLGCGSVNSLDDYENSTHEPWLCRALHELGTHVIGIDLRDLSGEKFEGYKLILGEEDLTKVVAPKSIDLACAFGLFDSPSGLDRADLFHRILPQLDRVVKPDGIFLFNPTGTKYHDKMEYGRFLAKTNYSDINSLEAGERK